MSPSPPRLGCAGSPSARHSRPLWPPSAPLGWLSGRFAAPRAASALSGPHRSCTPRAPWPAPPDSRRRQPSLRLGKLLSLP